MARADAILATVQQIYDKSLEPGAPGAAVSPVIRAPADPLRPTNISRRSKDEL